MAINYDPAITYNIDDFISMQNLDTATYYNLSILEVYGGVEHLYWNLTEDYIDLLSTVKVKFDDTQFRKYKYHPDLLAFDVYGSTQLDFIVLMLNDMADPKDFNRRTVQLPFSSELQDFLDHVNTSNHTLISYNRRINGLPERIT